MTKRVDGLDNYYEPIEKFEKWIDRTFWFCACVSLGIPYLENIATPMVQNSISITFILAVLSHSIILHYNSFFLIPTAENIRRKQLLSDAFDTPLTSEQTVSYYNNKLPPSIKRLGAIVLENAFFGKSICHEMAKRSRIKIFLYFLIWFAAISYRSNDLTLVLTLTQILFSGNILFQWIKVEILRSRNETIYEQLYTHFLNRTSSDCSSGIAIILNAFASYEAAKASSSLKQSSNIFFKLNPSLSAEWDFIKEQLKIDD